MIDALITVSIVLGAQILWRVWPKVFKPRKQRHFPDKWDGTHATCKCGHHSVWDWNLKTHFKELESAGK